MASKRVSLKGKGADLFFGDYGTPSQTLPEPEPDEPTAPMINGMPVAAAEPSQDTPTAIAPESAQARTAPKRQPTRRTSSSIANHNSSPVSVLASTLAGNPIDADAETVEAIRKVIKVPGREVSFVRLTPEEKAQLTDIVYTFKRQGQKTSETEINRIALNYLLHDFHNHGEHSILARVLAALLA